MGRLAALNPRSTQGKGDEDAFALARLRQLVEQITNPVVYERWILGFPKETRDEVRQMTRPFCRFTVEALRAQRLDYEARLRLIAERAKRIAEDAR
jgi:hypothetical protein